MGLLLMLMSVIVGVGGLGLGVHANNVLRYRDRPATSLILFVLAAVLSFIVYPILMVYGIHHNSV